MESKHNWTEQMENLEIGKELTVDAYYYSTFRVTRHRLRKKGFDFQFKLGKGLLTVRRTQ